MKNLLKNRRGFTLAEILLVVAIVVVLSGATIIGVASWVNQSQATANQLTAKSADFEKDAVKDVNEKKGTLKDNPIETESLPTGQQNGGNGNGGNGNGGDVNGGNGNSGGDVNGGNGNGGSGNGGNGNGGGNEDPVVTTTAEETTTTTTKASESQASGTPTTVGNITAVIVGANDKVSGVTSLSGDGNTQTFSLQKLQDGGNVWRDSAKFTITKNGDGTYTLKVPTSDARYMLNQSVFEGLWKSPIPDYKLTPAQISNLQSEFGINLK